MIVVNFNWNSIKINDDYEKNVKLLNQAREPLMGSPKMLKNARDH